MHLWESLSIKMKKWNQLWNLFYCNADWISLTCFRQWATSKSLYTKCENELESSKSFLCLQISTPSSSNVSRIAVIRNEISLEWQRVNGKTVSLQLLIHWFQVLKRTWVNAMTLRENFLHFWIFFEYYENFFWASL